MTAMGSDKERRFWQDVLRERERQRRDWGARPGEPLLFWISLLAERVGKLAEVRFRPPRENRVGRARYRLVQVAALSLAAWEECGEVQEKEKEG